GENPALEIIRNAIRKRTFYQRQLNQFQCEVYTKGQLRVKKYPERFLGQKIDFGDLDTSKDKMVFLSETISRYSVDKPNKEKIEVISSRVSGQSDGFGLSAPKFFSFYDNNVFIGNNLNPRGFISPIAENAMNYYKYKYEGAFYEDGKQVNRIRVQPRRKYEPLFNGYINIVEDEWRIHSLDLLLTKESQMEFVDTLKIEQLYRPVTNEVWAIASQVMYPAASLFGINVDGSFINIYSDFRINPGFTKKDFNTTILKYTDSSNKKTPAYWDRVRPVPLQADEVADYNRKDSMELARKDPHYIDSITKTRNKVKVMGLLLFGKTFVSRNSRETLAVEPLIDQFSFNVVEGLVLNTGFSWSKRLDSSAVSRRSITLAPTVRYGFLNHHINAHLTFFYHFGKNYARSFQLSGGKRVFQYNNNSPIGPRGNTLSSLLSERNRLKIYEAWYFRGSFREGIGHGFTWTAGFQYQDRIPLENNTTYTWRDIKGREYTPNYPSDLVPQNFQRHQSFTVLFRLGWQPGTRYIELVDRKINVGSKYPVFNLQYIAGLKNILGSDADFSKWKFTIQDDINFRLKGKFSYRLGIGGFISRKHVDIPDYQHFNGNESVLATEYLNGFQLLPLYKYSNTSSFYGLAHIEHNFHGFITNKIPGIKKLNLYLVVGGNGFFMQGSTNYFECFIGLDNIFKQIRIDFVQSYLNGKIYSNAFRIGLSRFNTRSRGDDWP
ncbi:MAG TPA: DUF5686 family protein, partial [Chitinophagaceae bacterium]|nr:DUF5686 family protein [Chitinophagaceae bacterium]